MSGVLSQLRALVGLRWRMVRSRRTRIAMVAVVAGALGVMACGVTGALLLPKGTTFNAALLTPTAFLVFAALSVGAPLAAGGGYDLFPAEQLVAYPIRPATSYAVTVLLAPLNVAWIVQVSGLLSLTAYVVGMRAGLAAALALTSTFIAVMTVAGQSIAWAVVGLRRSRGGRRIVSGLGAAAALAVVGALAAGHHVLDRVPTRGVAIAAFAGGRGHLGVWGRGIAVLVAIGVVGALVGVAVTGWALRRPDQVGAARQSGAVSRRAPRRNRSAQLRATDRASVWRAPALRRGALVIALLPGLVGAVVRLPWDSIAVTSGLVVAGAGLLYGVNVFCLDGSGALWLASLPHPPRTALLAKATVLTETCLLAAAIAAAASAARTRRAPSPTELAAVVASIACCTTLVLATCLRLSVMRPHRADLRGPRDTPAPPGTMAVYSIRLAVQTTLSALAIAVIAKTGTWWLPLATGAALALLGVSSLVGTVRLFSDDSVRTRVVITVANG